MAKAGDKRSPKRGRGKTPSPPEGGGQPAHELPTIKIQPSKEFAEQVRVAGEVIKRIGRRHQQPPTDTARIDRAIAHRAGITAHETGSTPAAPDTPAADQLPPPQPKITAGAWFKKAFIDHPIRLGEQTGDYANRLHPLMLAANVKKPWERSGLVRRIQEAVKAAHKAAQKAGRSTNTR